MLVLPRYVSVSGTTLISMPSKEYPDEQRMFKTTLKSAEKSIDRNAARNGTTIELFTDRGCRSEKLIWWDSVYIVKNIA